MRQGRRVHIQEEVLFVYVPCGTDVPCRKPARFPRASETVRTFIAEGSVDGISSLVGIVEHRKERGGLADRILESEIVGIVLRCLLESQIVGESLLSLGVLHAPAPEPVVGPPYLGDFHTSVQVYEMRIVEVMVPGEGITDRVARGTVFPLLEYTSVRKDGHRQLVELVRVIIKERVVLLDDGIRHLAVCPRLVGVILYVMLHRGLVVTE